MSYVEMIEEEYLRRKSQNSQYSLRAFSNNLGIHSSSLSSVLKRKRDLSPKKIQKIAEKLFLDNKKKNLFLNRFFDKIAKKKPSTYFIPNDHDHYKLISEWEHSAVLSLIDTKNCKPNPDWIAKRLGVDPNKILDVISRLQKLKLIQIKNNQIIKEQVQFTTTQDVHSKALQEGHKQELLLAIQKQNQIDPEHREFNSLCFSIKKNNIKKAKEKINSFIDEMNRDFDSNQGDEVYQLSIQLFPLTHKIQKDK